MEMPIKIILKLAHLQSQLLGRLRQEGHLSPGVWDQPGQHSETLSQYIFKDFVLIDFTCFIALYLFFKKSFQFCLLCVLFYLNIVQYQNIFQHNSERHSLSFLQGPSGITSPMSNGE
jgi:hypothetical protein